MNAKLYQKSIYNQMEHYNDVTLNQRALQFARNFEFEIVVRQDEAADIEYKEDLEFSDEDLKQIVFSLGSDYDQINFDSYYFYIHSEMTDDKIDYIITLED